MFVAYYFNCMRKNFRIDQELSDELLDRIFKFLSLENKLQIRFVSKRWKKIVNWQLKLIVTISSYPEHKLYQLCDEQYITSIPLSDTDNDDQNLNEQAVKILIPYSVQELFGQGNMEIIHIGPGVSGMSFEFLQKLFASLNGSKLGELSWTLMVQNYKKRVEISSLFQGLSFENITHLSLKLVQKPSSSPNEVNQTSTSRNLNEETFLQLLNQQFPMLHYLAIHLSSEPFIANEAQAVTNNVTNAEDLNQKLKLTLTGTSNNFDTRNTKSAWLLYMAVFEFIGNHSKTLRILAFDYYYLNLNLQPNSIQVEMGTKFQDQLFYSIYAKDIKRIALTFSNLQLQILNFYCPGKEGSSPWILGANLLSSQCQLSELVVKTQSQNPHLEEGDANNLKCSLEETLQANRKTLRNLQLTITGFALDFNCSLIESHKLLRCVELSCFRSLVQVEKLPPGLRKVKLKCNYGTQDIQSIIEKCKRLRKLTLQHNGSPLLWEPVTLETLKMCLRLETSDTRSKKSLRQICMYDCEEELISEYCRTKEQELEFSLSGRSKHKGIVKIKKL